MSKIKLTEIIAIWDILHVKNVGDLGYCDFEKAVEKVCDIENDVPGCQPKGEHSALDNK